MYPFSSRLPSYAGCHISTFGILRPENSLLWRLFCTLQEVGPLPIRCQSHVFLPVVTTKTSSRHSQMFPGGGEGPNHIQLRTTDTEFLEFQSGILILEHLQIYRWSCDSAARAIMGVVQKPTSLDGAALVPLQESLPACWPHADPGAQCCEFMGVPWKSLLGESWS